MHRCENQLRLMTDLSGLVNDDGESCQRISYYANGGDPNGTSRIRKYADPDNSGLWHVANDITVVFNTTTGAI